VNVLPSPSRLSTWISPPSRRAISREIDRPRPVPPYLRLVVPSACLERLEDQLLLVCAMPMAVSVTEKAIHLMCCARLSRTKRVPAFGRCTRSVTAPFSVNLNAWPAGFFRPVEVAADR